MDVILRYFVWMFLAGLGILSLGMYMSAHAQEGRRQSLLCDTKEQLIEFADRMFSKKEVPQAIADDINAKAGKTVCGMLAFIYDEVEPVTSLTFQDKKVTVYRFRVIGAVRNGVLTVLGALDQYGMSVEKKTLTSA